MADEYGSESYRGAVDVILHDPTGKEIHHARSIQDDEIEVDAHGTKARVRILHLSCWPHALPQAVTLTLALTVAPMLARPDPNTVPLWHTE